MSSQTPKRQRAVMLTSEGMDKFPAAKAEVKRYESFYQHYTLEVLGDRTHKDLDTLIGKFVALST